MGFLKQRLLVFCLFLSVGHSAIAAEHLVFTLKGEPYQLSRQQIKQIFLGGRLEKNGVILQPVIFSKGHPWRTVFNIRVMGLTESRLQSYWAQVKFTGKRTPPMQVDDFKQMLLLMQQPGVIGIAQATEVDLTKYQAIYSYSE